MAAILRALGAGLLFSLLLIGSPSPALADQSVDSTYGYDRTWNCGMRLIRVDMGLKITEKDESSGYILFDYVTPGSPKRAVPGSLEFVRSADGLVRVVVKVAQMPSHHEQVIANAFGRKLRTDFGDPPKKAPAPTPPPSKDAGTDSNQPELSKP